MLIRFRVHGVVNLPSILKSFTGGNFHEFCELEAFFAKIEGHYQFSAGFQQFAMGMIRFMLGSHNVELGVVLLLGYVNKAVSV